MLRLAAVLIFRTVAATRVHTHTITEAFSEPAQHTQLRPLSHAYGLLLSRIQTHAVQKHTSPKHTHTRVHARAHTHSCIVYVAAGGDYKLKQPVSFSILLCLTGDPAVGCLQVKNNDSQVANKARDMKIKLKNHPLFSIS